MISDFGICENTESYNYNRGCIAYQKPCEFFTPRGINKLTDEEFLWCQECKEYFHRSYIYMHIGHRIYNKIVDTDVEFNVESTFAGD